MFQDAGLILLCPTSALTGLVLYHSIIQAIDVDVAHAQTYFEDSGGKPKLALNRLAALVVCESEKLGHNTGMMSIFIVQVHSAVYAIFGEEGYIQIDWNLRRNVLVLRRMRNNVGYSGVILGKER
jgi:hypothetical protein